MTYHVAFTGYDFEAEDRLRMAFDAARMIQVYWPRSKVLTKYVACLLREYETLVAGQLNTRDYVGAAQKYLVLGVPDAVVENIKGQIARHQRSGCDEDGQFVPLDYTTIR